MADGNMTHCDSQKKHRPGGHERSSPFRSILMCVRPGQSRGGAGELCTAAGATRAIEFRQEDQPPSKKVKVDLALHSVSNLN